MALQAGVGRLEFSGIIVGYVGAVENWDLSLFLALRVKVSCECTC